MSFFRYSHYKRKGQGPAELTQELTNVIKIVQFLKISSTLSAFMNRGGDRAAWKGPGNSTKCQRGLWNSLTFFPFPTKAERHLAVKVRFSGIYRSPEGQPVPFLPRLGEEAIVHNDFLQMAPPPKISLFSHYRHNNCSSHIFQV